MLGEYVRLHEKQRIATLIETLKLCKMLNAIVQMAYHANCIIMISNDAGFIEDNSFDTALYLENEDLHNLKESNSCIFAPQMLTLHGMQKRSPASSI